MWLQLTPGTYPRVRHKGAMLPEKVVSPRSHRTPLNWSMAVASKRMGALASRSAQPEQVTTGETEKTVFQKPPLVQRHCSHPRPCSCCLISLLLPKGEGTVHTTRVRGKNQEEQRPRPPSLPELPRPSRPAGQRETLPTGAPPSPILPVAPTPQLC